MHADKKIYIFNSA